MSGIETGLSKTRREKMCDAFPLEMEKNDKSIFTEMENL